MAHALILGMTLSGKTSIAKTLCAKYKASGVKTIVLDPMNDPAWQADFRTYDPEEFLNILWASRQCAVFIDESGDMVGRFDKEMEKTATRSRHFGHRVHYISQRGTQISKTVRDQCTNLFLFTSSLEDGKIHAREWVRDELKECHSLKQGEYFYCSRFGKFHEGKLF